MKNLRRSACAPNLWVNNNLRPGLSGLQCAAQRRARNAVEQDDLQNNNREFLKHRLPCVTTTTKMSERFRSDLWPTLFRLMNSDCRVAALARVSRGMRNLVGAYFARTKRLFVPFWRDVRAAHLAQWPLLSKMEHVHIEALWLDGAAEELFVRCTSLRSLELRCFGLSGALSVPEIGELTGTIQALSPRPSPFCVGMERTWWALAMCGANVQGNRPASIWNGHRQRSKLETPNRTTLALK